MPKKIKYEVYMDEDTGKRYEKMAKSGKKYTGKGKGKRGSKGKMSAKIKRMMKKFADMGM